MHFNEVSELRALMVCRVPALHAGYERSNLVGLSSICRSICIGALPIATSPSSRCSCRSSRSSRCFAPYYAGHSCTSSSLYLALLAHVGFKRQLELIGGIGRDVKRQYVWVRACKSGRVLIVGTPVCKLRASELVGEAADAKLQV